MNIEVVEQMAHFNTTLPLVRNLIPFRLFTKVMGRFSRFMDWFGSRVIKRMIIDRRLLPVQLLRHIRLESGAIVITDRLELLGGKRLVRLGRSVDGTAIHVASSRYAQEADREVPGAWDAPAEFIGLLNRGQARRWRPGREASWRAPPPPGPRSGGPPFRLAWRGRGALACR